MPPDPVSRVLVLGASGYVGGRLIPRLLDTGFDVRCLSRDPDRLRGRQWLGAAEVVEGDLLDPDTLGSAFADVDVVYYLVHSLDTGEGFAERELAAARNARIAAAEADVAQIIYLGGLGDPADDLSPHLASRHAVGEELAAGPVAVTELRAAVILGSGSASFEMLRGLVEILPVMVTPKWVRSTSCQPIAITDVLDRLIAVVGRTDLAGVWEIGGADVVTYEELMQAYAAAADLQKRRILSVPVLTPRLSARWVDLVTSLPSALARELVESLQNDVVVRDRSLADVMGLSRMGVDAAIRSAIAAVEDLDIPTRWTPRSQRAALPRPWDPDWAGGTVLTDERSTTTTATAESVMHHVRRIGGDVGWYGFGPLWFVRGIADAMTGGVGYRRGRRHPEQLEVGDMVDAFVVERLEPDLLRLRAEMRMPGYGWLEWSVETDPDGTVTLRQTARFVPRGVAGRLYWAVLVPFHAVIFGAMVRRIAAVAEADSDHDADSDSDADADEPVRLIAPEDGLPTSRVG